MKHADKLDNEKNVASLCGIKAECLTHFCQDDIHLHQFIDNKGEAVFVGAVSDGCSGAYGSEHGASFLVHAFVEEATRLGKNGKRNNNFLHRVILALIERMANYKSKDLKGKIKRYHDSNVPDELAATLYGFVADHEHVLLVMAGDGFVSINGNGCGIDQENGDLYPAYILRFPRSEWQDKSREIFFFAEFESDRINDLILATDGFNNPRPEQYPGLTKSPAMFILQAQHHATTQSTDNCPGAYASRGHDDVAILAFGRNKTISTQPINKDEVNALCKKVKNHGSDSLWKDIEQMPSTLIRSSATELEPSMDPNFTREIGIAKGIHLFGITKKEEDEYARRKDRILNSRIFNSDPLAMFGLKKSSHTTAVKPAPLVNTNLLPMPKAGLKQKSISPANKAEVSQKKIPFQDICSPSYRVRHGIGFRHFGRVMYDLWHFIQDCHDQGLRIGNLRPCDLSLEILRDGKQTSYRFFLNNPNSTAKIDDDGSFIRNYLGLDTDFVHPDYLRRLSFNDQARLDQDWYAFSVLCYWFVTKFDPFGVGVVIANPKADRSYRMNNLILNFSSKIAVDERELLFIRRAIDRLDPKVRSFVQAFISRRNLYQTPSFLLDEFSTKNIVTCKAEIKKHTKIVSCGFKQLAGFGTCGYCETFI